MSYLNSVQKAKILGLIKEAKQLTKEKFFNSQKHAPEATKSEVDEICDRLESIVYDLEKI